MNHDLVRAARELPASGILPAARSSGLGGVADAAEYLHCVAANLGSGLADIALCKRRIEADGDVVVMLPCALVQEVLHIDYLYLHIGEHNG